MLLSTSSHLLISSPSRPPLARSISDPDAPVWPEYATSQSNMVFKRQRSYGEFASQHGRGEADPLLAVEKDDFRKEGIALMNSVEFGKELAH